MEEIKIKSAQEPKEFGSRGSKKLIFFGEDKKKYEVYDSALFQYIVPNTTIKADVAVSSRDYEGTTYEDRKVTQVYVEDKPVLQKAQKQGWQSRAADPVERASIEAQQAAKFTAELWIAGKFSNEDPQVEKLKAWLLDKLGFFSAPRPKQEEKPKAEKPTVALKKQPPSSEDPAWKDLATIGASTPTTVPDDLAGPEPANPISEKQLQDIQVYLDAGLGGTMAGIIKEAKWEVKHKEELTEDQAAHLIDKMESIYQAREQGLADEAKAAGRRD